MAGSLRGLGFSGGDQLDPKLGFERASFDQLKFSLREMERRFEAPIRYPTF